MPSIGPVAIALPPHRLQQSEAEVLARSLLGDGPIVQMFANGRIEERALAMPIEWYLEPHGFKDRNDAYLEIGVPLAEEAARGALEEARLQPTDLDAIVFVSTTGLATPSIDARLADLLGCSTDVIRLPLWGLGCAGGVAGLNRAADLVQAGHRNVLVVCLELCSLSFDIGQVGGGEGKKAVVAASLFADGAAALVVGEGDGPQHLRASSHLFPDSERVMGWDVEDDHLEVVLSPRIPDIVRDNMPGLVDAILAGDDVDHWVLHPGGARILDAYRDALDLDEAALGWSLGVLRDHGNMSSPTVLFALRQAMAAATPGQTLLLAALGPGFASEMAVVRT